MAENDGNIAIGLSMEIDRLKQGVIEAQAVIDKLTAEGVHSRALRFY